MMETAGKQIQESGGLYS